MNELQFEIACFIASKARIRELVNYQQVTDATGRGIPRDLGRHLNPILHYCKKHGLPPLTVIVVSKKDGRHPSPEAMKHIRFVFGHINIEAAQQNVFSYDWSVVPDFSRQIMKP